MMFVCQIISLWLQMDQRCIGNLLVSARHEHLETNVHL